MTPRPPWSKLSDGVSNPVVRGRKLCTRCGRWRLLVDFHARKRWDDGQAYQWQSVCRTCQRVQGRINAGLRKRGRPYEQERPRHRMTDEQRRERWKELYYEHRKDPEWLALRREYDRIFREAKRRAAGIPARNMHRATVIDHVERIGWPVEPLLDVLAPFSIAERELIARRAGVSPRAMYRYWHGEVAFVRIDLADRLAIALGLPLEAIFGDAEPVSFNGNGRRRYGRPLDVLRYIDEVLAS